MSAKMQDDKQGDIPWA